MMATDKARSQQKFAPAGAQGSANDWSEEFPKTSEEVKANNTETRKVHDEDKTSRQQGPAQARDAGDGSQPDSAAPLQSPNAYSRS